MNDLTEKPKRAKKEKFVDLSEVIVVKEATINGRVDGIKILTGIEILESIDLIDFFVGYIPFSPQLAKNKSPWCVVAGGGGTPAEVAKKLQQPLSNHCRLDLAVKRARKFRREGTKYDR